MEQPNSIIDSLREYLKANIKRQLKRQKFNFCTKFKARFDRNVPPLVGVLYRDLERTFDVSLDLIISRSLDEVFLSKTRDVSAELNEGNSYSVEQSLTSEQSLEADNNIASTSSDEDVQINDDISNGDEGELQGQGQPLKTLDGTSLKRPLEPEQAFEQAPEITSKADGCIMKECFICPIELCFAICDSKRELDDHLIHSHNLKPHYCALKDCGVYFLEKTALLNHQLNEHRGVTEWLCKECNELLPSRQFLNHHHMMAHFHRLFRCAVGTCKFNSSEYDNVLAHIRSSHEREYELLMTAYAAAEARTTVNGNPKRARTDSPNAPTTTVIPSEATTMPINPTNTANI